MKARALVLRAVENTVHTTLETGFSIPVGMNQSNAESMQE